MVVEVRITLGAGRRWEIGAGQSGSADTWSGAGAAVQCF